MDIGERNLVISVTAILFVAIASFSTGVFTTRRIHARDTRTSGFLHGRLTALDARAKNLDLSTRQIGTLQQMLVEASDQKGKDRAEILQEFNQTLKAFIDGPVGR